MTAEKVLAVARGELGNTESPAGSNRTKYGKWFGLDGNPWCMMFVMWCFSQAGALGLLPKRTASCGDLMRAAKAAGCWVTEDYRPGDVVIYDFSGKRQTTDQFNLIVGAVRPKFEEEDDMNIDKLTDADLVKLAGRMQAALAKQPVSATLAPELQEARDRGITDGSSPGAFCTRAQAAVMTLRAAKTGKG